MNSEKKIVLINTKNQQIKMLDPTDLRRILGSHGYEYIDTIGNGSTSSVYLCKSSKYQQTFAVKCLLNNKLKAIEYNALTTLHHPYIINLYESFEYSDYEFLVMDYCANDTLKQKKKLKYDKFIYYARQILEALSYCHSNQIAHRDIKPDNIFIDCYDRIKLADFGLSKFFDQNIFSNEKCGSLMYCAPEIMQKQSFNPFQADIWALGMTFFYMATGCFPYQTKVYNEIVQMIKFGLVDFGEFELNQDVKCLIQKMTQKNPALRPTLKDILKMAIFNQIKAKKVVKSIASVQFISRSKFAKNKSFIVPSSSFTENFRLNVDEDVSSSNGNRKVSYNSYRIPAIKSSRI